MSYRPNYPEGWRPPQQGDSWRPFAEQPNFEQDRHWTDTRVSYEGKSRLHGEHPMLSVRGDSWCPHKHEERTLIKREEYRDQYRGDNKNRNPYDRPHMSRARRPNHPSTPATRASARAHPNLSPSVQAFQPGGVGQDTSSNDVVPGPPRSVPGCSRYPVYRVDKHYRSANSSSTTSHRSSRSSIDALTQGAAGSGRYFLRSRKLNVSSPWNLTGGSICLDQFDPSHTIVSQQNVHGAAGVPDAWQHQNEHKQMSPRRVSPPPAPTATDLYLAQARLPVVRCAAPKRLLVILDLNGTLLVRPNSVQPRIFNIRPGVHQLLDYLFHNHVVMFYSSARPANVEAMVDALVNKKRAKSLAAIWGRDKLELTPVQYNEKVQVYKKLEKVWADEQIQATCLDGQRWSQANTVLVDDSHLKALSQPHNLIQVPEFTKKTALAKTEKRREHEIVASLRAKLEELKWAHDVSRHIFRWQTGLIEPPRASKLSPLPKQAAGKTGDEPSEPLTADSADDTDEAGGGVEIVSNDRINDVQAALEKDMEKLTTDPSASDESSRTNEPGISAEEWKEFLK
jgi:NLI interacting factor-like phosphatase